MSKTWHTTVRREDQSLTVLSSSRVLRPAALLLQVRLGRDLHDLTLSIRRLHGLAMPVRDGGLQGVQPLESLQLGVRLVLLAGGHPAFTPRPALHIPQGPSSSSRSRVGRSQTPEAPCQLVQLLPLQQAQLLPAWVPVRDPSTSRPTNSSTVTVHSKAGASPPWPSAPRGPHGLRPPRRRYRPSWWTAPAGSAEPGWKSLRRGLASALHGNSICGFIPVLRHFHLNFPFKYTI